MIHVFPYLNFDGHCREAMEFYRECLGGELMMQKLGESPMAAQMSSSTANRILHSHLFKNGYILMGSDVLGNKLAPGNSVTLCLQCSSETEAFEYFEKLAQGGIVKQGLHQTFRGATYGELTDKFGMNWILNFSRIN